jgi:hypothetical protein
VYTLTPGRKLKLGTTGICNGVLKRVPASLAAIYDAFERLSDAPKRWPRYLFGTRRFVLHRFPFSIIYLDGPSVVNFVAFAHSKRKPGYWKRRV